MSMENKNVDLNIADTIQPSDNAVEKKTTFGTRQGYPRLVDSNAGKVDELLKTLKGQQKVAVRNGMALLKSKKITLYGIYNQEWRICHELGILDNECQSLLDDLLNHYTKLLEVEFSDTVDRARKKKFEKAIAQKTRDSAAGMRAMLLSFIVTLKSKYPKYQEYIDGNKYLPGTVTMTELSRKKPGELEKEIKNSLENY